MYFQWQNFKFTPVNILKKFELIFFLIIMGNTCSPSEFSGSDAKVHIEPIFPTEFDCEKLTEASNKDQ